MKVLSIKFGTRGEKIDAFGVRLYGDMDARVTQFGRVGEILSDPDAPAGIEHQRITLWFTFGKILPYAKVSNLLGRVVSELTKEGFAIMVSSVDELVDTTSPEYKGTPESQFPASDRMHGYNASGGFSISAENVGSKPKFSMKEIEEIQELAIRLGRIVYGRSLKKAK